MAALIVLAASTASAATSTWVRATLDPSDQAYVGQYIRVNVDVLSPEIIPTSPVIDLPPIDGGVILQQSAFSVRGSETIEGTVWQRARYSLALFPHREGLCEVPPIGVRFAPKAGIEGPLSTDPARVQAVMPPGAVGLRTLVSTPSLKVTEAWSPEFDEAKVGDAFRHTITMTAESVLGMGFPPLTASLIDGLGVYPGDPDVRDQSNRGQFTGTRIEGVTYVCERPGTFEIPGITIPWFDMRAGTLKEIELPGRTLEVAPNPALVSADGSTSDHESATWGRWLWFLVPVSLTGVLYRFRARIGTGVREWRRRRYHSEPATFRRLLRTARHGAPAEIVSAWLVWLDRASQGPEPITIRAFMRNAEDRELESAGSELLDTVYGHEAALLSSEWNGGAQFARCLARARKRMARTSRSPSWRGGHSLVPLNR